MRFVTTFYAFGIARFGAAAKRISRRGSGLAAWLAITCLFGLESS
jgi:hypothetical protein